MLSEISQRGKDKYRMSDKFICELYTKKQNKNKLTTPKTKLMNTENRLVVATGGSAG